MERLRSLLKRSYNNLISNVIQKEIYRGETPQIPARLGGGIRSQTHRQTDATDSGGRQAWARD